MAERPKSNEIDVEVDAIYKVGELAVTRREYVDTLHAVQRDHGLEIEHLLLTAGQEMAKAPEFQAWAQSQARSALARNAGKFTSESPLSVSMNGVPPAPTVSTQAWDDLAKIFPPHLRMTPEVQDAFARALLIDQYYEYLAHEMKDGGPMNVGSGSVSSGTSATTGVSANGDRQIDPHYNGKVDIEEIDPVSGRPRTRKRLLKLIFTSLLKDEGAEQELRRELLRQRSLDDEDNSFRGPKIATRSFGIGRDDFG